jgi:hypothetical protein
MMLEMRRPTNGMPDHCAICSAIVSLVTFDSAYVVPGTGKWSSSTGAYRGGRPSPPGTCSRPPPNGRPSVVSLDAHTTRERPSAAAAWNTLKFIDTLLLNVTAGVCRPGAGMFARWTTASVPRRASVAWP